MPKSSTESVIAVLGEPVERRQDALRVGDDHALGDLEHERVGRHVVRAAEADDDLRQVGLEQHAGGEVDRDGQVAPWWRHSRHARTASSSTWSVIGTMKPVCSAMPMKSSGAISPRWRWRQRTSASAPHTRSPRRSIFGWNSVTISPSSSARRRSPASVEPDEVVRVLLARVALDAGAARLRLVHRDVGALHQRLDVAAVVRVGRHADAAADVEPHAGDVERLAERAAHASAISERGVGVVARQQDGELVAAEPGDGRAERDPLLEPQRRPA